MRQFFHEDACTQSEKIRYFEQCKFEDAVLDLVQKVNSDVLNNNQKDEDISVNPNKTDEDIEGKSSKMDEEKVPSQSRLDEDFEGKSIKMDEESEVNSSSKGEATTEDAIQEINESETDDILKKSKNFKHRMFGISNIGNTCFFNATMQCLNASKELVEHYVLSQEEFLRYDDILSQSR